MNYRAAWIVLAATVGLLGQTSSNKTAPTTKVDTWQKSKECAAQAEKIMTEYNRKATAVGGAPASHWENHYSSKYNRCFISATNTFHAKGGDGKYGPLLSTQLIDAFERSVLANTNMGGSTEPFCDIDDKPTDCVKAEGFVSEHMKN